MADIGEPLRHKRVMPLTQPSPQREEPVLPPPPVRVPDKEKEPVR